MSQSTRSSTSAREIAGPDDVSAGDLVGFFPHSWNRADIVREVVAVADAGVYVVRMAASVNAPAPGPGDYMFWRFGTFRRA